MVAAKLEQGLKPTHPRLEKKWLVSRWRGQCDEMTQQGDAQAVIAKAGDEFFNHALNALEATQADYKALSKQLKQSTGKKRQKFIYALTRRPDG
jgi:hypothetical protein